MRKKIFRKLLEMLGLSLLILFVTTVLLVSVRGKSGNPTSKELLSNDWMQNGPFELSPERGRYALLYSMIEDKSFSFSTDIARFATPDVAFSNGKYVSLFAPLVSFTAVPGYLIGKSLGVSQVGAYATVCIFAILNILLIRLIAIRLGAGDLTATVGGLVFGFASPAFAYAVTLYQHHISTFLILATLYLILRFKNWISLFVIWLLFAASIPVDYPNLALMFPLALYATTRIVWLEKERGELILRIKPFHILTFVSVILPLLFYVWFSHNSYEKPFQLSGTLKSVQSINEYGLPEKSSSVINTPLYQPTIEPELERKKSAVRFFKTRNMLNGLYLHFISPDRGMLFFTPIMLFALVGAFVLWKKDQKALALIAGVVGTNIVLYSMWGDPWGGWAFGSRYLIPSYALFAILISIALSRFARSSLFLLFFISIALYSIAVNTLGAITTSTNPPKVEVLALEKLSKVQEKYTFERNWDYLSTVGTKSYAYNTYFNKYLSPTQFYWGIVSLISFVLTLSLIYGYIKKSKS